MQSQQSIHSPSPRGRGLGIGVENKHFFEKNRLFLQVESREYLLITHGLIVFNFYGSYISP